MVGASLQLRLLGGGHETAYGHFCGYVEAEKPCQIINWDAHLDVRQLKQGGGHSGSPFRQALEHPSACCKGYRVAGLQGYSVSKADYDYAVSRQVQMIWRDELSVELVRNFYSIEAGDRTAQMLTFDIDAVDISSAPGVSAPAVNGLDCATWLLAAEEAGKSKRVTSMDIVECSPPHDTSNLQTAYLAAMTVWSFLRGLAQR